MPLHKGNSLAEQPLKTEGMYLTVASYRAEPNAAGSVASQDPADAIYAMDGDFVDPAMVGEPDYAIDAAADRVS
jgi:hypothetical protein